MLAEIFDVSVASRAAGSRGWKCFRRTPAYPSRKLARVANQSVSPFFQIRPFGAIAQEIVPRQLLKENNFDLHYARI